MGYLVPIIPLPFKEKEQRNGAATFHIEVCDIILSIVSR
jgi:hypothetical protein